MIINELFIKEYIKNENIDKRINDNMTPLLYSIHFNDIEMVKECIEKGANIEKREKKQFQNTPLLYAIYNHYIIPKNNNIIIIKYLLENNANVNVQQLYLYNTPLHIATYNNDIEMIKLLIKYGANPNIKDLYKFETPIFISIMNYNNEITKYLLDNGAEINIFDSYGKTPLIKAVSLNNQTIYDYIIMNKKIHYLRFLIDYLVDNNKELFIFLLYKYHIYISSNDCTITYKKINILMNNYFNKYIKNNPRPYFRELYIETWHPSRLFNWCFIE